MVSPPTPSPLVSALGALARAILARRWLFILPQIVLFGLAVYWTGTHLGFKTSRNDLVGDEKKYHQIYLKFLEEFDAPEDVVVIVESGDPEKNRQFVERLGARLNAQPETFQNVLFRSDLGSLGPKALFFLQEENLQKLEEALTEYQPFLARLTTSTNLVSLFGSINGVFREGGGSQEEATGLIDALPALRRIIDRATESLGREGLPPSPGISALFGATEESETSEYVTFDEAQFFLLSAQPAHGVKYGPAIRQLRADVEAVRAETPGVNAGVTGGPVLEKDEMDQAQRDMMRASVVSFVLVALVFVFGYHETGRPLKATASLLIGLGYTMGYTTLAVGHLNILTITFAPILIGLAIDLGIHLVSRFEEELLDGQSLESALTTSMIHTGKGIFTGALTTAAAFFAMALTPFDGIREMGVITGGGMLVTLIPMMTFLPALLIGGRQTKLERGAAPAAASHRGARRARVERLWLDRPIGLLVGLLIFSGLAATQLPKCRFDYNLLNLQTDGIPSVTFEKKLINAASKSVVFCASIADDVEDALRKKAQFEALPSIASVETMATYLGGDWRSKEPSIERIRALATPFQGIEVDRAPIDISALRVERLNPLKGYLFYTNKRLESMDRPDLMEETQRLRNAIAEFLQAMPVDETDAGYAAAVAKLSRFQQELFLEMRRIFTALANQRTDGGLTAEDLPPELRNRFIGRTGKQLLQIYPREDVWEREPQKTFIGELRSIDPEITGTPVQQFEYTSLLVNSYLQAGGYALIAILAMACVHFRSLIAAALTLVPVLLGGLWTLAVLGLTNVPLNPANIMTLPLVIGIGVTNGVHILNRFQEEGAPELLAVSTGKAVIVSGLTTIAGFASLLVAQHQGIASLGFVMSIGVGACLLAGLTVVPACLLLLQKTGWKLRTAS